jgi:hypothetical protein
LNSLTNTGIIVLTVILNILPLNVWGQESELSEYDDHEGRFTIGYPSDWIVNEEPSSDDKESVVQFDSSEPDITSFGADLSIPSVRIGISDAKPDETSLEALTNKKVKDLESIGMPTQETERTTLSGLPAHSIKSTIGDEAAKNVFALYDGKVYQIIFRAQVKKEIHWTILSILIRRQKRRQTNGITSGYIRK